MFKNTNFNIKNSKNPFNFPFFSLKENHSYKASIRLLQGVKMGTNPWKLHLLRDGNKKLSSFKEDFT